MKNIITINRQYGAGGSTIGKAVAERLGLYYCDRDMIIRTAIESGNLSPEEIRLYDEKVPKEFGFGQSLFEIRPLDERLYKAQRDAIRKVAEAGNCVIVGRNTNIILKEFDRSLHVFIAGTEHDRLKRMAARMPEIPEEKILEHLHSVDKARKKYCKHYTDTEFGNVANYDLSLKSSTFGIDGCVDLICAAAQQ